MPRATFAGVTFDLLVTGLEDRHEGFVTAREIPGATDGAVHAYVDLGGRLLPRRTVTIRLDSEDDYFDLFRLVGTAGASGTMESDAEGHRDCVLVALSRTWRKGHGPQLCRSEWLFLN